MELMIESFDSYENTRATSSSERISQRPVDLVHLARYTLGDAATEHEVLALFRTQSQFLLQRLKDWPDQASRQRTAKTLKASARGIGAWAALVDGINGRDRFDPQEGRRCGVISCPPRSSPVVVVYPR